MFSDLQLKSDDKLVQFNTFILEIEKDIQIGILKAVIISFFKLREGNHSPCLKVITQVLVVALLSQYTYILGQ